MCNRVWVSAATLLIAAAILSPVSSKIFGSRKSKSGVSGQGEVEAVAPTYIDTLNRGREVSLSESDFVVEEEVRAMRAKPEAAGSNAGVAEVFRVQCFASNNIGNARAEKSVLESKLGLPVYMVFIEPYYKLHVGDFTDRGEAEKVTARIKQLGYEGAWIVHAKVQSNR